METPDDKSVPQRQKTPPRPIRVIVDEYKEKAVTVVNTTVIFRPGQLLDSDHLIRLAKEHNILTRER